MKTVYEQLKMMSRWFIPPMTIDRQSEYETIIERMFPNDGDCVQGARLLLEFSSPQWLVFVFDYRENPHCHFAIITPNRDFPRVTLMRNICGTHQEEIESYFAERLLDRTQFIGTSG